MKKLSILIVIISLFLTVACNGTLSFKGFGVEAHLQAQIDQCVIQKKKCECSTEINYVDGILLLMGTCSVLEIEYVE